MDSGLFIYHLFLWSNGNFLHTSQWITLPTKSCVVLYSLWANLLHSLMWLIVLSITSVYIYFVSSCLFLLWHRQSLWWRFVLPSVSLFLFPSCLRDFHTNVSWWTFLRVSDSRSSQVPKITRGVQFSSYFQFLKSSLQAFRNRSKFVKYNWYHCHPHVQQHFWFSGKVQVFVNRYLFILFSVHFTWTAKSNRW